MSFGAAIGSVYSNYFNFKGRARRSEYWWFVLFNYIILFGCAALAGVGEKFETIAVIILCIYFLGSFIPLLSLSWRRIHDVGKSGWSFLVGLIPLVGSILLLSWYCSDSEPGENKYGSNPKGIQSVDIDDND